MLVTFSGMVGSGKTTNAKKTLRWLCAQGYAPYYLRFRFITWRSVWRTPAIAPWRERENSNSTRKSQTGASDEARPTETHKRLTFALFLGYLLRIAQFRLFMWRHHRSHLIVLNRYFYDSFMHYRCEAPREQKYLRWLVRATPQPDLAILLVVRPETAQRRRPAYAFEFLRQLSENTAQLQNLAPHIRVVATDNLSMVDRQVEKELRAVFKNGKSAPRNNSPLEGGQGGVAHVSLSK